MRVNSDPISIQLKPRERTRSVRTEEIISVDSFTPTKSPKHLSNIYNFTCCRKLSAVNKWVIKALCCSVCNEYMKPPMRQLKSGKNVCERCYESGIMHTDGVPGRSYALESMFYELMKQCEIHPENCYYVSAENFKENLYMPLLQDGVDCYLCNGGPRLKKANVPDIFDCYRKAGLKESKEKPIDISKDSDSEDDELTTASYMCKMTMNGEKFACIWQLDYIGQKILGGIFYLGSGQNCHRYVYDVYVEGRPVTSKSIIDAPCIPLQDEQILFPTGCEHIVEYDNPYEVIYEQIHMKFHIKYKDV